MASARRAALVVAAAAMSWFSRALTSAKEAVGSVSARSAGSGASGDRTTTHSLVDSARAMAGGVLSSVARVADDKVRRVGKSLHARVTGRQSFEDAVRHASSVMHAASRVPP